MTIDAAGGGPQGVSMASAFLPLASKYEITTEADPLCFELVNENYAAEAVSDHTGTVEFSTDGTVSVKTEKEGKSTIAVTANEGFAKVGLCPTVEVTSDQTTELSLASKDEGIVIEGNGLEHLTITGTDYRTHETELSVKSDKDSLLVSDTKKGEIVVSEDSNGDGTYDKVIEKSDSVVRPQKPVNISKKAKVSLSKTSYTYSRKKKKPGVTVKIGKSKLTKNKDYTIAYKDNTKVGTACVVISGKGKYAGKLTKKFKILPKGTSISGKLTAKPKQFTVKWKKQPKSTTGYQVQYSTSKKFTKKATVTKMIKKVFTTKLTVKNLKAKKKYYVRVRTYKTVKGKKYCSRWSGVKSVTTKAAKKK